MERISTDSVRADVDIATLPKTQPTVGNVTTFLIFLGFFLLIDRRLSCANHWTFPIVKLDLKGTGSHTTLDKPFGSVLAQ